MVGHPIQSVIQSGFTACSDSVYVTGNNVRYRSTSDIQNNNIIGTFSKGKQLTRVGKTAEWSAVLVDGKECYLATQYLSMTPGGSAAASGTATSGAAATGGIEVSLNSNDKYAGFSKINSGKASYYKSNIDKRKEKVVCINAGHGTSGGENVKTQCHPDGSAKVTGGTTGKHATSAVAVSGGMTFSDGTAEAKATLAMAKILKDRLLAQGYDVIMIRESNDVQLDNVARTVIANNNADCHIALHWDSTASDKGAFFMSVPNNSTYRAMEPVASHWQQHNKLGESLVNGLKSAGNKIFSGGSMEMDLTQTSYSTIPSVDIELGDKNSDHSDAALSKLADGLVSGINSFFG
ncbi:MAG: N-acetylmuramoyl-L-alanine amidase [Clostridium sp.]